VQGCVRNKQESCIGVMETQDDESYP